MPKNKPNFYLSAFSPEERAIYERYVAGARDEDLSPSRSAAARRLRAEETVVLRLVIIAALFIVRRRFTGAQEPGRKPYPAVPTHFAGRAHGVAERHAVLDPRRTAPVPPSSAASWGRLVQPLATFRPHSQADAELPRALRRLLSALDRALRSSTPSGPVA